jgi:hypothetical protein
LRWLLLSGLLSALKTILWPFPEERRNSLKPIDQTGLEYPIGSFPVSNAEASFGVILDETCVRLEGSRNRGALKRIRKMEEVLRNLEDELDAILAGSQDLTRY